MFDISFSNEPSRLQDEGWLGLPGVITIGDYSQSFVAPLVSWTRGDYERQWLQAAQRLLGSPRSVAGFVTQPLWFWWPAWRADDTIVLTEAWLGAPSHPALHAADGDPGAAPYHVLANEAPRWQDEDGREVSRWAVSVNDMREFVGRSAAARGPV